MPECRTQNSLIFKKELENGEHLKWMKEIFNEIAENLSECSDKDRNSMINKNEKMVMNLAMDVLELRNRFQHYKQFKPRQQISVNKMS